MLKCVIIKKISRWNAIIQPVKIPDTYKLIIDFVSDLIPKIIIPIDKIFIIHLLSDWAIPPAFFGIHKGMVAMIETKLFLTQTWARNRNECVLVFVQHAFVRSTWLKQKRKLSYRDTFFATRAYRHKKILTKSPPPSLNQPFTKMLRAVLDIKIPKMRTTIRIITASIVGIWEKFI